METYRTPDERFADLPGFDWEPQYADVPDGDGGSLRMAYVDARPADGAGDAPVALLLHGEPTWSFLYRDVVDVLVAAGVRCVVPDLVGLRALGQAAARRGPLLRPPRRVGPRPRVRPPGPARRHARRSGLGRADRAAAGRREPRPLRPRRRQQHRHADRRLRHARDLVGLPHGGGDRGDPRRRSPGRLRLRARARRRRARGVRRPVPGRGEQGRTPRDADARADPARRPGHRGQPRRLGRAAGLGQAVPDPLLRLRPDHRRHGPGDAQARAGLLAAWSTPRSSGRVTSSRRTPGPSSAGSWPTSSAAEHGGADDEHEARVRAQQRRLRPDADPVRLRARAPHGADPGRPHDAARRRARRLRGRGRVVRRPGPGRRRAADRHGPRPAA